MWTLSITVGRPEARPSGLTELEMDKAIEKIHERNRMLGIPVCERCGWSRADKGILRKDRCYSCDADATERVLRQLIKRVGREEAIRRFQSLATEPK